jgi:hypothetical protein
MIGAHAFPADTAALPGNHDQRDRGDQQGRDSAEQGVAVCQLAGLRPNGRRRNYRKCAKHPGHTVRAGCNLFRWRSMAIYAIHV